MPSGFTAHLDRPLLYGRIDLENDRTFYFTCVAFLAVAMLVAFSFRKNRSGRVLIAARDNQRAAPSYAINLVRARLAAFAVSGGTAGMAGVLFAYAQHNVIPGRYRVANSIAIFLATVIGGLTSVPWAVVGAVSVEALTLFGPRLQHVLGETLTSVLPLLALGPLLILNLYFYPGGTAEANFKLRDKFLRWVAKRHDILVPSLVADRRVETGEADTELIEGAEHSVVEAERNEIVALLGTNGAGKSTLLKAISGLVDPMAGEIWFDGDDITHIGAVKAARLGIVQVPGGRAVFPTLTVAENFRAANWLYSDKDPALVRGRTEQVVDQFPRMRERWDQMAGNLSGGEQQQLALGMAFVAEPNLLIIDELSLGLAPTIVEQLLEIVRSIHEQGATVILVEQSVNVALTIAERAYFMEKGEVRFSGPTEELLERGDILRSVLLMGAASVIGGTGTCAAKTPDV